MMSGDVLCTVIIMFPFTLAFDRYHLCRFYTLKKTKDTQEENKI